LATAVLVSEKKLEHRSYLKHFLQPQLIDASMARGKDGPGFFCVRQFSQMYLLMNQPWT
jgi:hypothetical protein